MKQRRDALITVILLAVLVGVTLAVGANQGQQQMPVLSRYSNAATGAHALELWARDLGYQVIDPPMETFIPPQDASLIFMLEPLRVTENDIRLLGRWVDAGGTLVINGQWADSSFVMAHFNLSTTWVEERTENALPHTPLFRSPVVDKPVVIQTAMFLRGEKEDHITLLAADGNPVLVTKRWGKGRVFAGVANRIFSNIGLKDPGNAQVALNLLTQADGGKIWFDEWHHGFRQSAIVGPEQWLRESPMGRSLLFVVGVGFVTLLLRGWAFGRAVPLPKDLRRRGVMEHIVAMANLSRRAGHRKHVLKEYHRQLKRHLGQRYRLDTGLADALYVETLAKYNPSIDQADLLDLLTRLNSGKASEAELIHLASRAAKWIQGN